MPIRAIARQLGISKNTVKRALATDRPPRSTPVLRRARRSTQSSRRSGNC
ncbi:helix-turn-helix domain-containing protein [Streptomyces sp. NPDC101149]